MILECSFNFGVALPQKHNALLFAGVVIVLLYLFIPALHFRSKTFSKLIFDVSNSYFLEEVHSLLFASFVDVFQLLFFERTAISHFLIEFFLENVEGFLQGFLAFVFANVGP